MSRRRPCVPCFVAAALLLGGTATATPQGKERDEPAARPAGCPAELYGAWSGTLDVDRLFRLRLLITRQAGDHYTARLELQGDHEEGPAWTQGDRIRFQATSNDMAFDLRPGGDDGHLEGFVHLARHISHIRIPPRSDSTWAADWSYPGDGIGTARLDLYIEDEGESTGGYFFFRDPRLPSLFGEGVHCEGKDLRTRERNLGMSFVGPALPMADALRLVVSGPAGEVPITFRRMADSEIPDLPDASATPPLPGGRSGDAASAPEATGDGWSTARPSEAGLDPEPIASLVEAIAKGEITATHAVLVARHGRLVVEEYFYGFDRETPHDLRSASKTFASTLIGLAVRDGILHGESSNALGYLDYREYDNWDPRKARITLRDLMTMSSGLNANDYDPESPAAEGAYQSSRSGPDWVKTALDAPMIEDPGVQPQYGGANPLILGGVLQAATDEPVEWFAHRTLFGPLGIHGYRWFTVPATGSPYFGGGMWLRPRDMLKIGQLYLDGGTWKGERILPERWVHDSFGRYGRLAPLDINGHQYGYLWWHHQYQVGDETIETVEARGYGGQYIFVVPELDMVAVVTAGNFRNRRTRQSEEVLRRFVLPMAR